MTDLDVLNLTGLHTFVQDLRFFVIAPSTTNVRIWNRPCGNHDDFNINFDQASMLANTWPCPPTSGLTYQPTTGVTLNTFNNVSLKGLWRMQVQDAANLDGGSLQTWGLKTCVNNFCRLNVGNTFTKGAGSLFDAVNCAVAGDTIRFASNVMNDTIFLGADFLNINKNIFIEADITKNIHIMCTSTNATIVNTAPNVAEGLEIKGLHIHSSNNNIGAIKNQGKLTLQDVYLYKFPGASTATIDNSTGASTDLIGNCRIIPRLIAN
ncbi:MAG: proprotein convertase P-domain-containing protein [Saprospiraceae bacterium]|nr:proprotein convertase P-domain-containing protein [Saprospiraceae bacterium]